MFLKIIAPFFLLAATLNAVPIYIGTSTGKSSTSKGIYQADFDSTTGKLSEPTLAVEYQNPSYLALHPSKPLLYACGIPNNLFPDESGSVVAFNIGENHGLKFLGEVSSCGKGTCHLAIDATGKTVAIANYGDGSLSTVKLDDSGLPTASATVTKHSGDGPNKPRQDGPHAHGVYFDKANKHLFVPDLGLDRVFVYPFDATTSELGTPLAALTTMAGAGPRHMTFSADEKFAYVINELDNTVLVASYVDGKFKPLTTVKTLPDGYVEKSTTSEIEVHPDGKFVYGSNRGHDSLTVYHRDEKTGNLTLIQHAPCGGKTPRHFKIDPTGKWLLCAHQGSNTISVLSLDPATGLLGEPSNTVSVPSPTCLLFSR